MPNTGGSPASMRSLDPKERALPHLPRKSGVVVGMLTTPGEAATIRVKQRTPRHARCSRA